MHIPKLQGGNSSRILMPALVLACSAMLVLPACNVKVKKNGEGEDKKVDIETPIGGLHVSKGADVRDIGLPVYPGARRKEGDHDGQEKSANVNISSSLFGLRVVAIEYLSDDPPDKIVAYYTDQLKRYGSVLECHTNKKHADASMNPGDDSKDSEKLKCEGDNDGKVIELKVGTEKNQHIVSIQPANSGKGSDFGLVYIQMRGGKETI